MKGRTGAVCAEEEKMSEGDGNAGGKTYFVDQSGAAKADDRSTMLT